MLLDSDVLRQFQNHSSQMAALDFIVSTASDVFIPTFDGNMAKLVEGHRRYGHSAKAILFRINVQPVFLCNQFSFKEIDYLVIKYFVWIIIDRFLGFRRSVVLDRRKLIELLDLYTNKTISWDNFASSVREAHKSRVAQPSCRRKLENRLKEEDYFYANPHECLANSSLCS